MRGSGAVLAAPLFARHRTMRRAAHGWILAMVMCVACACVAMPARAGVPVDASLALPDRFVEAGLLMTAVAPDSAVPTLEGDAVNPADEPRGFLRSHPVLGRTLVFIGYQALLAIPSAAAYADEEGKVLAGVDAAFAALTLITPDGGRGETIGGAVGVLALAGGVLAAANNGASKDQLFALNWVGLNVAILGGRWIGSKFD